jgi:hypothetical protein
MQQNDVDNGTEGVSGNVQSSLQSLLASALGAALEPVSRLETDYKVLLDEREGYRDRLATLQQQLATAESSSIEQSKENRILKHQKTKLEEQHDKILKQQKGLEDVNFKFNSAQEMIKTERQEAGERHDHQERTLSQKAIETEELAQEVKQQAQKSATLFNKNKELQARLKEQDLRLGQQAEETAHLAEEVKTSEKRVAEQEQSLSKAKERENWTLDQMNQQVAEADKKFTGQSEARAAEQNAHHQQLKSLSEQHEKEVDTIEEEHASRVSALNDQLRAEVHRGEVQAAETKRLTEEGKRMLLSKEKAERELGRTQQEHTVLESEAHVMTEQNSSWEVQLKEMRIRETQHLAELSALQEDNEKNDEDITQLKNRLLKAAADADATSLQHKQLVSVLQRSHDEKLLAKVQEHTKGLHAEQQQAEQERASNVARKAEAGVKIEQLGAQVQALQRERDDLAENLLENASRGTQESGRTAERVRELETKLEDEAAERARERMEVRTHTKLTRALLFSTSRLCSHAWSILTFSHSACTFPTHTLTHTHQLGKQVQTYKTANRVIKAEQVELTRSIAQQLETAKLELHKQTEELAAARATIMQLTEERARYKQASEAKAAALSKLKTEHTQATEQLAEVRDENAEYERVRTKQALVVEAKTTQVLLLFPFRSSLVPLSLFSRRPLTMYDSP